MIGFEVCKQLIARGHKVHLFDAGEQILRLKEFLPDKRNFKIFYGSILDSTSLRSAMEGCGIVIHLAALLGVKRSEQEKLSCLDVNIIGMKNVLDCAVKQKVKKIVFASSSEVYGEPLENPITEKAITQGKTIYAITKLAGEELCKAYKQTFGIDFVILRYFNCYGPFQTAQFVLPKFIKNVKENKSPVVFGNGKQIRSYTYVSDTARATISAAFNSKANGEAINVGNGNDPIDLKSLADLVIKIGGKQGKLKPTFVNFENSDRKKEREIIARFCDSRKAKKILNWQAEVAIKEGIEKTFNSGILFDRWEGSNLFEEQN